MVAWPRSRRFKARGVSLALALLALVGLALQPACDAFAGVHEADGAPALLAQAGHAPAADASHRHGGSHQHDDGPCCTSVEDGSLVRPLEAVAADDVRVKPVPAGGPNWQVLIPNRAAPSSVTPPPGVLLGAFHARSAPLRR